ncbi:MAG: hypothetical protein K2X28_07250 [Alphaproteobacteria bacterium]|nr:hypothetical protein [Alphaproteobacteria bacterium]
MRMYFIALLCISAIYLNLYYHPFLEAQCSSIKPKKNDLFYALKDKNIIVSEKGEYKTNFFFNRCATLWHISGVKQLKKENYKVYSKEIIKNIPSSAKKACFSKFNICAFWLEGENFESLYLIDFPREDKSIFDSTTLLFSPKIMKLIE